MLLTMGVLGRETVRVTSSDKCVTSLRSRRLRSGFTLAELLVGVGLFSILSATALPSFSVILRNSDFNAAARQVAADARYARSMAISRGSSYRIHVVANSVRIEHRDPVAGWPAADAQVGNNANVITNWQDLSVQYHGVTLQSVLDANATAIDAAIFNSSGASVDGSNAPQSVRMTVQKSDGSTRLIQVDPTGNVKTL